MTAPAYTSTWIAPMNWRSSMTKIAASAEHRRRPARGADATGFRCSDAQQRPRRPRRRRRTRRRMLGHLLAFRVGRDPTASTPGGSATRAARGRTRTARGCTRRSRSARRRGSPPPGRLPGSSRRRRSGTRRSRRSADSGCPASSSPGTSLMQLAGQICGQRPQATHLERPCSSVSMRWVPRHRGEMVQPPRSGSGGSSPPGTAW